MRIFNCIEWDCISGTQKPKEIITKIVKNINEFYTKVH